MPRYYFHLVNGGQRISDEIGEVLEPNDLHPGILLQGLERLRMSGVVDLWDGWSVEITNAAGSVVQVLVICHQNPSSASSPGVALGRDMQGTD
jgi:hypothetical protein